MEREQVLDELVRRVRGSGGSFMQTVKSLAEEFGEKPERLYYLIRTFEDKGQLATTSHGPQGTEFRLGTGRPPAVTRSGRRGAGDGAGRGRGTARSHYCPWCGQPVESGWSFCAGCGKKVPAAK